MSLHYHARWDLEKFRTRSTSTRRGTLKFSMSLHYHAPRDLEKFPSRSTTTRRGTLEVSLSLHYDFLTHCHMCIQSKASVLLMQYKTDQINIPNYTSAALL